MKPIPVESQGQTVLVPRLRVQQIIDLSVLRHDQERRELKQDLEDAGVDPAERLERLREHRKQVGLSSVIVQSAFSVGGAYQIIRLAMGGDFPESFEDLEPTRLTEVALGCLGIELDDLVGDGSAEGKDRTDVETGSPTLRSSSANFQG
jgi:hypothetical protein